MLELLDPLIDGPLHPALVHVPVALAVLLPLLAGLVALGSRLDWWSRRTWVLVVVFQAVLAGGAWLALEAGERDEELVETYVGEKPLHDHEEAGELLVWGAAGVLGLAVLTLLAMASVRAFRWGSLLTFLATLVVAGLAYRAAKLGGALVYEHGAADAHRAAPR